MQGNPFSVYGALALTNLEALANGEGGATGTTTGEYVYYDFNGQRWYGVENEGTGFRNSINAIYRGNGEIMCIVLSVREIVGMEPPVFIELNN